MELRSYSIPTTSSRICPISKVYVNIYFTEAYTFQLKMTSIHLSELYCLTEDLNFCVINNSNSFLLSYIKQKLTHLKFGLLKYYIALDFQKLDGSRKFVNPIHEIKSLQILDSDSKVLALGEREDSVLEASRNFI